LFENVWGYVSLIAVTIFTALVTYALGGWDMVLKILIIMTVVDYITGVLGAIVNKKLSSKTGFKGIIKKVCLLLMVVVAHQVDKILGQQNFFRQVVCLFYISNEGLSILENMAGAGVPFPDFLTKLLIQLRDNANDGKGGGNK
jgi:toxin secretion/phage lysis holin